VRRLVEDGVAIVRNAEEGVTMKRTERKGGQEEESKEE
jgi:hypothetical protein